MATIPDVASSNPMTLSAYRLLVVEDAAMFQAAVKLMLEQAGYSVSVASTGEEGLELLKTLQPDLVVLDLGLPGIGGMEVCRQIREASDSNIVMLTGRKDDESRFAGLEIGADAYVTKPFEARELLMSIRVLLRRRVPNNERNNTTDLGHLRFDRTTRQVWVGETELRVTKIEMSILEVLVDNHRSVVTRTQLIEAVWGPSWVGGDHVVSVHIANLRKKISTDNNQLITTLRGIGYRLEVPAA